jgi:ureidoglycolate lyase
MQLARGRKAVDLLNMTAETFAPFGVVLEPPAVPGRTQRLPLPANLRPEALPTMTLIHLERGTASRQIDRMERHRHAGQAFLHLGGGALLVVVAATDANGGPDLTKVTAFRTTAGQGFAYHPDIWHAGVSALDEPARVASLLCCDGSADDVEELVLHTASLIALW